jgi:hypothetical protein
MNVLVPDPYTTSLVGAMYYIPPIRYTDRVLYLIAQAKKEEKSSQQKVQPTENIGRYVDTYA